MKPTKIKDYDLVLCNINEIYKNISCKCDVQCPVEGNFYSEYESLVKVSRVPFVKLYKSEIIKKQNLLFQVHVSYAEDEIFNLQYFEYVNEYFYVDKALYNYNRTNEHSLSQKITKKAFMGSVERLKFAKIFYDKHTIKNGRTIINSLVLYTLKKYSILTDDANDFNSFKNRVICLRNFIFENSTPLRASDNMKMFLLKKNIIFPLWLYFRLKNKQR